MEKEQELAIERKKRLILFLVASVAVVVVVLCYFTISYYRNSSTYAKAEAALSGGDYETAITVFRELGDFKDAELRLSQALEDCYAQAEEALSKGEYETAVKNYQTLGDFRDAMTKISQATELNNKAQLYAQAEEALSKGDYETAVNIYQTLGDFRDAMTKTSQATELNNKAQLYAQAEEALSRGDYRTAINNFRALDGFHDAKAGLIKTFSSAMMAGAVIPFGGYDWRVLEVQDGRALILSNRVIEKRAYHGVYMSITWAQSNLRNYLNSSFYNSFSAEDRALIAETKTVNNDNSWFGTNGGSDTNDKIFLLSIEEVVKYFGDSGQLMNKNPNSENWIDDQHNPSRQEVDFSWWLRSPGNDSNYAAFINVSGRIIVYGNVVTDIKIGVRPALWINM